MGYDLLTAFIQELGYAAFFFALCFGIIGLPIPNEAVVMTGGAVAASGLLSPVPTFIAVFLGIACGLTSGYLIGKAAGLQFAKRIESKKSFHKTLKTSERLRAKYGSFAICLFVFLPLLRHLSMYIVGLNKMPYPRYAAYTYSTAVVWTAIYFLTGYFVEEYIEEIGYRVNRYGIIVFWCLLSAVGVYGMVRFAILRKKRQERPIDS